MDVVVVGGGSGHYPAFGGIVGAGLAHGAAMGNVFASPSAQQIYNVAKAVNAGGGILFSYGNYAGDVLNFNQAQERLRAEGIDVRTVAVTDDIASAGIDEIHKRRGIAVAVCASGNYLAGSIWPAIAQKGVETLGWRETYIWIGIVCGLGMLALSFLMRQRPPLLAVAVPGSAASMASERPFGLSIKSAHALLCVAGVACCVAMAMPQVHIVAYCSDLGFGGARGSEMLSLMLACGIVSRLVSGAICDRIGGLRTLVLGSVLQGIALLLFLPFDGMVSLYVISALFGLFQGGIVPSYAIIVREYFPAQKVGVLVGAVIMATMIGMALGGWMSGKVFDLTGSYHAAFVNGVLWNALNLSIALFLLWRTQVKKKA